MAGGSNPIDDFYAGQRSGGSSSAPAPTVAPPPSGGNPIDNFYASQGGGTAPSSNRAADGTPLTATTPFPSLPSGLGGGNSGQGIMVPEQVPGGAPGQTRMVLRQPPSQASAVPTSGGGIGGWLGRLGSEAVQAVQAMPAGFAHFALDAGKTATGISEYDAIRNANHTGALDTLKNAFIGPADFIQPVVQTGRYNLGAVQEASNLAGATNLGHGFSDQLHQDFVAHPLTGILNTATTAAMVAPAAGGALSRLAEALPADSFAANAAAAGAKAAATVGSVGEHVASLPLLPYQLAAHGLAEASPWVTALLSHVPAGIKDEAGNFAPTGYADRVLGRPTEFTGVPSIADRIANLHQRFLDSQTAAYWHIKGGIAQRTGTGEVAAAGLDTAKAAATNAGISPDVFGAAVMSLRNDTGLFGPKVAEALANGDITPAQHAELMSKVFAGQEGVKASQQTSPAMAAMAEQFRQGTLPPETAGQIEAVRNIITDRVAGPREARELSGAFRPQPQSKWTEPLVPSGLNPEQTQWGPLPNVIRDKTGALQGRAERASLAATKAEQAAADASVRRGGSTSNLDVIAKQTRRGADALMRAADRSKAEWSDAPEAAPKRLAPALMTAQQVSDHLRVMAEAASSAGDGASGSALRNLADSIPTKLSEAAALHEAGQFANPVHLISERPPAEKQPYNGPGRGLTAPGKVGAQHQANRENLLVGTTPQQFTTTEMGRRAEAERVANVREAVNTIGTNAERTLGPDVTLSGRALRDAMNASPDAPRGGYVAFNPAMTFTEGRILNDAQIGPHTIFMPKGVLDALAKREAPTPGGAVGRAFDAATRMTYKKWLNYSPMMMVRKAVWDAFAVKANTDMSWRELATTLPKAAEAIRNRDYFARAARDTGLFADEANNIGRAQGRLASAGQSMRRASEFVDTMTKVAVMMHEAGKGAAPEDAAVLGVKALGDWGNMTPRERGTLARIAPVYPFIKQVGLAVAKYGDNHPLMTAFLMHLGDAAAQDPRMLGQPSFLKGNIPLGGNRFFNASSLFPPSLLSSATAPGGFINPAVKGLLSASVGLNTNRHSGSWNTTSPGGTFGKPRTGGVQNLTEAEFIALKNNPLGKLYLSQFATPEARFDTGEPILNSKGQPTLYPTDNSLPGRILSILGIPINQASPPNPKAAKNARTLTKAQQRYQQQLQQQGEGIPGLP